MTGLLTFRVSPENRATAQPRNRATAQPRNRATAQPRNRAGNFFASANNAANLAALKLKGWTDAETTAFQTARDAVGPTEQYRVKSISGAKDTTTQKNADAATLYENILTIKTPPIWNGRRPTRPTPAITAWHLPARPRR